MLAGRESLAKLIGKRRRNLPREALLDRISHARGPNGKDPVPEVAPVEEIPASSGCISAACDLEIDWVECPVCGKSIRGNDNMVNSHLDSCLLRGKKRKLTQTTLLQLNFYTSSHQSQSNKMVIQQESTVKLSSSCCTDQETPNVATCYDQQKCDGILDLDSCALNGEEDENMDVSCNSKSPIISSKLSFDNIIRDSDLPDLLSALSTTIIETFIVGHRFHKESDLSDGSCVHILRDPENIKDQHALKVCLDVGGEVMVGYLPRQLAKFLSPLVAKFKMRLEASVSSNCSTPGNGIPVRIFCRGIEEQNQPEASDFLHLKMLWKDVLHAVDYERRHPPNKMKYQQNFLIMVQDVLARHTHVLKDDEKKFICKFDSLSDDAQRVFIRLYTRKGPWFRISNISYEEVDNTEEAIKELQLAGYISPFAVDAGATPNSIAEILDILTVSELRELSSIVTSKRHANGARKDELISQLLTACEEGKCPLLPNLVHEHIGVCVKISLAAELILWRVQRLFFLNGEQDLSSFLLVDLGFVKYPTYTCIILRPIFQDHNEFLEYEEAIAVAQLMDESIDEKNAVLAMRCTHFSKEQLSDGVESMSFYSQFSASWIYTKVVTLGISICEREHRYEDAVQLLRVLLKKITCGRKRGYWYLRLSVDLEHLGRMNESLSVAEEGIQDPWVRAGSKIALQRRVLRLGKPPRRWKIPSFAASVGVNIKEVRIQGRPLNCETGARNCYYGYDGMRCNVEQLALQYYEQEDGWKGVHTETGIWLTIFALLMWDVIFSDVPDVFQTRFQTSPLDLDSDSFYSSRKDLVESQLQKIEAGMAEEIIISSWDCHIGTACRGVNWDRHCLVDLRAAVSCIGSHCLASLMRHLTQDYSSWSSGMPDLFLWRFHGGVMDGGEAKLVEVKGPRDRLSEQQRAWMLFLIDCGFDVEICKVSETPLSSMSFNG